MSSVDESSESDSDRRFTADRFIPSRDGASMSSIYAALDEARSQNNQSPDPNKGT